MVTGWVTVTGEEGLELPFPQLVGNTVTKNKRASPEMKSEMVRNIRNPSPLIPEVSKTKNNIK